MEPKSSANSRQHGIARRIFEARRDAGLTQQELAELTGISQFSISKWENGHTSPRASSLREIARATGREIAWFFASDEAAA